MSCKTKWIIMLSVCTLYSCNKCYDCKTSSSEATYCKGSQTYDLIKQGQTIVDVNGNPYTCTLK